MEPEDERSVDISSQGSEEEQPPQQRSWGSGGVVGGGAAAAVPHELRPSTPKKEQQQQQHVVRDDDDDGDGDDEIEDYLFESSRQSPKLAAYEAALAREGSGREETFCCRQQQQRQDQQDDDQEEARHVTPSIDGNNPGWRESGPDSVMIPDDGVIHPVETNFFSPTPTLLPQDHSGSSSRFPPPRGAGERPESLPLSVRSVTRTILTATTPATPLTMCVTKDDEPKIFTTEEERREAAALSSSRNPSLLAKLKMLRFLPQDPDVVVAGMALTWSSTEPASRISFERKSPSTNKAKTLVVPPPLYLPTETRFALARSRDEFVPGRLVDGLQGTAYKLTQGGTFLSRKWRRRRVALNNLDLTISSMKKKKKKKKSSSSSSSSKKKATTTTTTFTRRRRHRRQKVKNGRRRASSTTIDSSSSLSTTRTTGRDDDDDDLFDFDFENKDASSSDSSVENDDDSDDHNSGSTVVDLRQVFEFGIVTSREDPLFADARAAGARRRDKTVGAEKADAVENVHCCTTLFDEGAKVGRRRCLYVRRAEDVVGLFEDMDAAARPEFYDWRLRHVARQNWELAKRRFATKDARNRGDQRTFYLAFDSADERDHFLAAIRQNVLAYVTSDSYVHDYARKFRRLFWLADSPFSFCAPEPASRVTSLASSTSSGLRGGSSPPLSDSSCGGGFSPSSSSLSRDNNTTRQRRPSRGDDKTDENNGGTRPRRPRSSSRPPSSRAEARDQYLGASERHLADEALAKDLDALYAKHAHPLAQRWNALAVDFDEEDDYYVDEDGMIEPLTQHTPVRLGLRGKKITPTARL